VLCRRPKQRLNIAGRQPLIDELRLAEHTAVGFKPKVFSHIRFRFLADAREGTDITSHASYSTVYIIPAESAFQPGCIAALPVSRLHA
jgi:hypothetical protein